jgi:hypothetical protein
MLSPLRLSLFIILPFSQASVLFVPIFVVYLIFGHSVEGHASSCEVRDCAPHIPLSAIPSYDEIAAAQKHSGRKIRR